MKLIAPIIIVAGTRPEVIKLSELVQVMKKSAIGNETMLLYTGQHYSTNMRDIFFDELGIIPDYDLAVNTSNMETIRDACGKFFKDALPEHVIVYGDTNSTLAAAMAAKEHGCKVTHIEAGLRSFDMRMPEERNRIQVDAISDYLLAPTELSRTFLSYGGRTDNIFVTGNLIVDVCRKFAGRGSFNLKTIPEHYALLTLHRMENVDDPQVLEVLVNELRHVDLPVVFPIHPRTSSNLTRFGMKLPPNVITIDPLGYLDFLALVRESSLILTDSGGLQEEAAILGKPCITLRHTTERWETLLIGANILYPLLANQEPRLHNICIESTTSIRRWSNPFGEDVTKRVQLTIEKLHQQIIA